MMCNDAPRELTAAEEVERAKRWLGLAEEYLQNAQERLRIAEERLAVETLREIAKVVNEATKRSVEARCLPMAILKLEKNEDPSS